MRSQRGRSSRHRLPAYWIGRRMIVKSYSPQLKHKTHVHPRIVLWAQCRSRSRQVEVDILSYRPVYEHGARQFALEPSHKKSLNRISNRLGATLHLIVSHMAGSNWISEGKFGGFARMFSRFIPLNPFRKNRCLSPSEIYPFPMLLLLLRIRQQRRQH